MKANEAPEKIFIQSFSNEEDTIYFDAVWTEEPEPRQENIEYTSTDAFIEKAQEAFCKAMCDGNPPRSICTSLGTCKKHDNFVKYMKGE